MGWELVAYLVISMIVSYALAPKAQSSSVTKVPEAAKDIEFPQAEEGTPQAVIFGDCWSGDWTVLSVARYRTEPIYKST